ncbi:MAG: EAL domain-containing protein, partial [Clostridium sp.]
ELLLNGILYIATVMNMDTVVEGVETKEQAELLKKLGYRVVQGFYFSKPVPQEVFEQMLGE